MFNRTKHGSDKLMKLLEKWGFCVNIHGNKSQTNEAHWRSSARGSRDLVATDVAARGLDIPEVAHVITTTCPTCRKTTCTALASRPRSRNGKAIAFCAPLEIADLRSIEKAMKKSIPVIGGEVYGNARRLQTPERRQPGPRGPRQVTISGETARCAGAPQSAVASKKAKAAEGAAPAPRAPSRAPKSKQSA